MERERTNGNRQRVLLVDADVLVRHELAEYLRHCGYEVVEAATTDEALKVLAELKGGIDALLCDAEAVGEGNGFALARRIREEHPEIAVLLAGGPERAAQAAGELCDDGPQLKRPYDPTVVVERIRRSLATRARSRAE